MKNAALLSLCLNACRVCGLTVTLAQAARYAQQLELETLLDLQQLVALPDARIQITITNQLGRSLSNDALHNQFQVQELYTTGQNTRLAELDYQQDSPATA